MPSRVPGNRSCTACAMTCAAECRSTARPSGEDAATTSTSVSASGAQSRSLSTPSGSRTTTAPSGPVRSTPASRSASTAVVPAATRMGRAGVDGTLLADTGAPLSGVAAEKIRTPGMLVRCARRPDCISASAAVRDVRRGPGRLHRRRESSRLIRQRIASSATWTPAEHQHVAQVAPAHRTRCHRRGARAGGSRVAFAGDVHFAGRVAEPARAQPAHRVRSGGARAAPRRPDDGQPGDRDHHRRRPAEQGVHLPRATARAHRAARRRASTSPRWPTTTAPTTAPPGCATSLRGDPGTQHFPVIGIGANAAAAFAPYRTTLNGVKLAIFAADQVQDETTLSLFSAGAGKPGVANAYEPRADQRGPRREAGRLRRDRLRALGHRVPDLPVGDQSTLASALAAAGASAVIGTHAHVLQGAGWRTTAPTSPTGSATTCGGCRSATTRTTTACSR